LEKPIAPPSGEPQGIDTLGVLARQWRFVLFWVAAATVLAAVVSFLLPEKFRATAYLLVNPSPYKSSSLEQPPFQVDTYERMLRSPALVEQVRRKVGLEDVAIENLLNRMRVVLIRRANIRETKYAPLILLEVEDKDPSLCRDIANTWAELATSASLRIRSAVIKRDNERITKQFEETKKLLEEKEDNLKKFNMTARLVEKKAELEMLRKQLTTEQENLERLRIQLSVAETRLDDLKNKYASFFPNGIWIGSLAAAAGSATSEPVSPKNVAPLPLQFLLARNDLLEKTRRLVEYKTRERVSINKHRYAVVTDKIERLEKDIALTKLRLAAQKAKLAELESESAGIPDRLVVAKAIADEALWTALAVHPRALDELTSKRLVEETLNPVWLSMQGRLQYVRPETASLEAQLKSSEKTLAQLRAEQDRLDSLVVAQEQAVHSLQMETDFAEQRYETLFGVFLAISHDIMNQEAEVARLRREIANTRLQVDRLSSAVQTLNDYTVEKTLEQERLQRELASVKNIFTSLATKYEEARITELEVSGDLQIAFPAALPEAKIAPKRTLIAGTAFIAALILFTMLAVARDYIRRQPAV